MEISDQFDGADDVTVAIANHISHVKILILKAFHIPEHFMKVKVNCQTDYIVPGEVGYGEVGQWVVAIETGCFHGVHGDPVDTTLNTVNYHIPGQCLVHKFHHLSIHVSSLDLKYKWALM